MKKYIVSGKVTAWLSVELEAENAKEAIEKAYDNVGIDNYCGNGGVDKLIGVCNTDEATASIYADSEFEYLEVEEIE